MSMAKPMAATVLAVALLLGTTGCSTDDATEVEELDMSETQDAEQADQSELDEASELETTEAELEDAEE
jgi:uncharacterized lipoprotein